MGGRNCVGLLPLANLTLHPCLPVILHDFGMDLCDLVSIKTVFNIQILFDTAKLIKIHNEIQKVVSNYMCNNDEMYTYDFKQLF